MYYFFPVGTLSTFILLVPGFSCWVVEKSSKCLIKYPFCSLCHTIRVRPHLYSNSYFPDIVRMQCHASASSSWSHFSHVWWIHRFKKSSRHPQRAKTFQCTVSCMIHDLCVTCTFHNARLLLQHNLLHDIAFQLLLGFPREHCIFLLPWDFPTDKSLGLFQSPTWFCTVAVLFPSSLQMLFVISEDLCFLCIKL